MTLMQESKQKEADQGGMRHLIDSREWLKKTTMPVWNINRYTSKKSTQVCRPKFHKSGSSGFGGQVF